MSSNKTVGEKLDEIFLGQHTDRAECVCDTLYPTNSKECNCWVKDAKQAILDLIKSERINATYFTASDIGMDIGVLLIQLNNGDSKIWAPQTGEVIHAAWDKVQSYTKEKPQLSNPQEEKR